MTVCTSCKTSYNVLSHSHWGLRAGSIFLGGGGLVKKIQSPDLRSPEVGISAFGHCLFCIEWLLEEPFCVGEVFSTDWWGPLKLDIWFRTFNDARSGKFHFLDSSALVEIFCIIICLILVEWTPSSSSLSSPSSLSSSPARYLEIIFLYGSGYVKCLCRRLWQWSPLASLLKFCELTCSCTSYCFLFYILKNSNGS